MTVVTLSAHDLLRFILALVVSYVLVLPLGLERKRHAHAAFGLRVFPLVAIGACSYVFLGQMLFVGPDSNEQADVLQGLMVGIGFIGAGAILKESHDVHGLSTAASVWTTGAIGASVAYGRYALAVGLSLVNLFVLHVTWRIGRKVRAALGGESSG
jgi:putative Mg2+ transporter-C (MgtC) family protein